MVEPSRAELKYLVERQREEIKTLNDVGRLLSTATDPKEIVRSVASYLRHTFPLALCGVLTVEQRKLQVIRFATISQVDLATAVREICTAATGHLRQPLQETLLEQTIEDAGGSGQWAQPISYLRSNHSVPLTVNGKVIGLLSVFSGKNEAFNDDEQHAIAVVADQLGAALRNAFLVEELRLAGELKSQLLMVISHELRIPLTSIQEGVGLVLDGSLGTVTAEQNEFLTTVKANAARLETLISKVVMATQLVTGQLPLTIAQTDASAILKDLETTARPLAESKGVQLDCSGIPRSLPCRADAAHLTRAISHLVENAIQASPAQGRVTIHGLAGSSGIEIHIRDTGAGIPAEEVPKLFDMFSLVGGVDERKTGGLGLGLFIANAIVKAHGGTLQLESQVGHGTHLSIRLPSQEPA